MSGTSKKVAEALNQCQAILDKLEEPFAVFVFEAHGCSIANGFCCPHHMKENVVGLLQSRPAENLH